MSQCAQRKGKKRIFYLKKKKKEQTPGMLHAVFFLFYFLLSFFDFESEYNAYLRLLVTHK